MRRGYVHHIIRKRKKGENPRHKQMADVTKNDTLQEGGL